MAREQSNPSSNYNRQKGAEQEESNMHEFISPGALILGAILILSGDQTCSASIDNELRQAHFEYPGPAISERDLPICPSHAVCSVLHNRYWMLPIVKRLCRCTGRMDCPWKWTDYPDNYTMHLDNRSQLKFCDEVTELPECGQNKPALTVTTTATADIKEAGPRDNPTATIEEEQKLAINVSCFCATSSIWEEEPPRQVIQSVESGTVVVTQFKCKPMKACSSLEFCGHIRVDYFSTYYQCSCPIGHMCLNRNRTEIMVNELLYDGQAYQAFCFP